MRGQCFSEDEQTRVSSSSKSPVSNCRYCRDERGDDVGQSPPHPTLSPRLSARPKILSAPGNHYIIFLLQFSAPPKFSHPQLNTHSLFPNSYSNRQNELRRSWMLQLRRGHSPGPRLPQKGNPYLLQLRWYAPIAPFLQRIDIASIDLV
ncbi:uncharacterized protein BDV17DRAFT_98521 [Aspergillus undulatus]|uniref:uncharacterized protein n=1 Tax=Aspergillus undulatus TaxID=1810928 RepID=UPI003CCCE1AD